MVGVTCQHNVMLLDLFCSRDCPLRVQLPASIQGLSGIPPLLAQAGPHFTSQPPVTHPHTHACGSLTSPVFHSSPNPLNEPDPQAAALSTRRLGVARRRLKALAEAARGVLADADSRTAKAGRSARKMPGLQAMLQGLMAE